jgi:hypothetical protein
VIYSIFVAVNKSGSKTFAKDKTKVAILLNQSNGSNKQLYYFNKSVELIHHKEMIFLRVPQMKQPASCREGVV